jgi:hypothetical protein
MASKPKRRMVGASGRHVVADEQFRVAPADQAEEQHRIGMAAQLHRAAGEEHHGPVAQRLHPFHAAVERGRAREQAAPHEDQVGLGHAGVLHRALQGLFILPEVRVDQHGQQLAARELRRFINVAEHVPMMRT